MPFRDMMFGMNVPNPSSIMTNGFTSGNMFTDNRRPTTPTPIPPPPQMGFTGENMRHRNNYIPPDPYIPPPIPQRGFTGENMQQRGSGNNNSGNDLLASTSGTTVPPTSNDRQNQRDFMDMQKQMYNQALQQQNQQVQPPVFDYSGNWNNMFGRALNNYMGYGNNNNFLSGIFPPENMFNSYGYNPGSNVMLDALRSMPSNYGGL